MAIRITIGHIVQNVNRTNRPIVCFLRVMIMQLRIRDLREDKDLTQRQLADYLLCDQSLYSKYERGERPLPLEYADKLADFYAVSVDYLLGRTNIKKPYPKKR